jgi:hypothetical protein
MEKFSGFLYPFLGCFAMAGLFMGYKLIDLTFEEIYLQKNGLEATGTVVKLLENRDDGSTTTTPVVEFETKKGELITYQFSYSTNINPAKMGDKLTVLYDPLDPKRHSTEKEKNGMTWVSIILMLTHGGVGFGGMIWLYRKRKFMEWISTNGQMIQAAFYDLKKNAEDDTVTAKWTDPNTQIQYSFYETISNLDLSESDFVGKQISVIIDPKNPKRYIMDLSNWGGN